MASDQYQGPPLGPAQEEFLKRVASYGVRKHASGSALKTYRLLHGESDIGYINGSTLDEPGIFGIKFPEEFGGKDSCPEPHVPAFEERLRQIAGTKDVLAWQRHQKKSGMKTYGVIVDLNAAVKYVEHIVAQDDDGHETVSNMDLGEDRVTRISYNSARWTRPTGEAAQQEVDDTFNARTGFGFEDWLFRDEWQLEGWRYAFLQGVNKSHAKLVRDGVPIDVTLFTVNPDKSRTFVAEISDLECLSDGQAARALDEFKRQGWLNAMVAEVKAVGGDSRVVTTPQRPRDILNVRFRLDQVRRLDIPVPKDDPVMQLHRYVLSAAANVADGLWMPPTRRGRAGRPDAPAQAAYLRKAVAPVFCTPEHGRMQEVLVEELRAEYPKAEITCEENFVDVRMRNGNTEVLYEIKTDLSPTAVLRQAIGQLLEYAHHSGKEHTGELLFVAVGRNEPSTQDAGYLQTLKARYRLPISYRAVAM